MQKKIENAQIINVYSSSNFRIQRIRVTSIQIKKQKIISTPNASSCLPLQSQLIPKVTATLTFNATH